jgi:hypothetical protein
VLFRGRASEELPHHSASGKIIKWAATTPHLICFRRQQGSGLIRRPRRWRTQKAQVIIRDMKVRIPDNLGLPAQQKVEAELLKLLVFNPRPLSTSEIYRQLADTFALTPSQRVARREPARLDPAWNWLVRRAMQRLEAEGWAYRPDRAVWAVTEMGRSQQQLRQHGLPDIFEESV